MRRGYTLLPYTNTSKVSFSEQCKAKQISIFDENELRRELFDQWPDAVINCAAISSPDTVDQSPQLARSVNIEGAEKLAQISAHIGARHIHLSTDMVFDGTKSPYRSTDIPNPMSEYGRQKLEAEKKVLAVTEENLLVLRITLLNGNSPMGGRSPHEKILRALASGFEVNLFDDEFRQPCSAENLSDVLIELVERPTLNGLFHWAGNEEISRYELGVRILRRFGIRPEKILRVSVENFTNKKGEYRPRHLSFILNPLSTKIRTQPTSVDDQLEELQIPADLYSWYREFSDDPSCYIPRF
jgi:dTDP-4-dehydrorhamnose reductase